MAKVDQFESVFRSASKEIFHLKPLRFAKILVVTDLPKDSAELFARKAESFLNVLRKDEAQWEVIEGSRFTTLLELLKLVEEHRPDLIVTYRHLHSTGWKWKFSLGEHVDLLTQATTTPILLLPHPEANLESEHAVKDTNSVMAMTDHLTGDERLVNFAVHMVQEGGKLFLTHIENQASFEKYIRIIGKIPELDTDLAREEIKAMIEKEAKDYIRSCMEVVKRNALPIVIEKIVTFGRHLDEYKKLIETHKVDLLVFNTKDDDQLAMHGLAYPLAIEIRQIPLLML